MGDDSLDAARRLDAARPRDGARPRDAARPRDGAQTQHDASAPAAPVDNCCSRLSLSSVEPSPPRSDEAPELAANTLASPHIGRVLLAASDACHRTSRRHDDGSLHRRSTRRLHLILEVFLL